MIWRPHHLAVSISSSTKLAPLLLSANNTASTSTITVPFQSYHSIELMVMISSFFRLSLTLTPHWEKVSFPFYVLNRPGLITTPFPDACLLPLSKMTLIGSLSVITQTAGGIIIFTCFGRIKSWVYYVHSSLFSVFLNRYKFKEMINDLVPQWAIDKYFLYAQKSLCLHILKVTFFQKEIPSFSISSEANLSISRTPEIWLLCNNSNYRTLKCWTISIQFYWLVYSYCFLNP